MTHRRNLRAAALSCAVLILGCGYLGDTELKLKPIGRGGEPTSTTAADQEAAAGEPQHLESIVIEQPGIGSRLVDSVLLHGMADPTHEQNLGVRLLVLPGEILADGSALIDAPLGERGSFQTELAFSVDRERTALIQVFSTSARDGKFTHMTSTPITLAPSGESQIETNQSRSETIVILEPADGEQVADGSVIVRGRSLGLLQNALTIEIQNEYGGIVGLKTITINPAATRVPTEFETEVGYRVDTGGVGRIVVREPSTIFGRSVHIATVGIDLQP